MNFKLFLATATSVVVAAAGLGAATAANSKVAAALSDSPPEYYQCMDGCTIGWLNKDKQCGRIGQRYSVSSYEYEICTWEREDEFASCARNCDLTYPPRD
ncbi:MAG: hypothetical protein LCH57_01120 [Proteobacteria bacterium]|nr:hypothetical protein [Pseudomonadota bacterium]